MLLEMCTILYEEYRYASHWPIALTTCLMYVPCQRDAYFHVINLVGANIFNYVGDHHHQRDGILEADAAKLDDMAERIRDSAY